jgi:uncharacterized protein
MQGRISHIELGTSTGAKTSAFFTLLFSWKYSPMGEGGGVFDAPTCKAGLHPGDPNPGIVVYFAVNNIEAAAIRVKELGGQAGEISPNEPGFGRFCPCKDPEGVAFGLHQPGR